MATYLVTGGAGFIGSHVCDTLLARGEQVVCLDNFNDYYSPARKRRNIAHALEQPGFTLVEGDFRDQQAMEQLFAAYRPARIAHIGGMAGPRSSVERPLLYEEVNIRGTLVLLEMARRFDVDSFVLASTSSVYGRSPTPWSEEVVHRAPVVAVRGDQKSGRGAGFNLQFAAWGTHTGGTFLHSVRAARAARHDAVFICRADACAPPDHSV